MIRSIGWLENGMTPKLLQMCLAEHQRGLFRLCQLEDYYEGEQAILRRKSSGAWAPNNRLCANFPKYITSTICGYVFGENIGYEAKEDAKCETGVGMLRRAYDYADILTHDAELAKDVSIFGVGYERFYLDGESMPKVALVSPRVGFLICDDTVEQRAHFGVCYREQKNMAGETLGYAIEVLGKEEIQFYEAVDLKSEPVFVGSQPHFFGDVPMVCYRNNEECMGDFEHVVSLVDAYNVLQSDRLNDKERFVSAILLIKNAELSAQGETADMLKNGILQMPLGSDANYLTKSLNETEIEVLRRSLASDIHKFSQTPDFTDEGFFGNTSGVAMRFKLLSLEYLAKVKERFFVSGLKKRMRRFAYVLSVLGIATIVPSEIDISFVRKLPINELEDAKVKQTEAQTLQTLVGSGMISRQSAMAKVSNDVKEEQKRIENEAQVQG